MSRNGDADALGSLIGMLMMRALTGAARAYDAQSLGGVVAVGEEDRVESHDGSGAYGRGVQQVQRAAITPPKGSSRGYSFVATSGDVRRLWDEMKMRAVA